MANFRIFQEWLQLDQDEFSSGGVTDVYRGVSTKAFRELRAGDAVAIEQRKLRDRDSEDWLRIAVGARSILAVKVPGRNWVRIVRGCRRPGGRGCCSFRGWAHECRGNADDLLRDLFDQPHLVVDLVPSQCCQVRVIPGVATDEESPNYTGSNEDLGDVVHVDPRPVVECQGHLFTVLAATVYFCKRGGRVSLMAAAETVPARPQRVAARTRPKMLAVSRRL